MNIAKLFTNGSSQAIRLLEFERVAGLKLANWAV